MKIAQVADKISSFFIKKKTNSKSEVKKFLGQRMMIIL